MSRGIHTKPNNGSTNDWITPPKIVAALGKFTLDPCAHPNQFYRTASYMIAPPADGLKVFWHPRRRVWLNPPYGQQISLWLERLSNHGNGVALVPARTEVESWFWPFIWDRAHAVLFLRGRLYFHKPDGALTGNAGHGSVLVAYGSKNAGLLAASGIVGRYFKLKD